MFKGKQFRTIRISLILSLLFSLSLFGYVNCMGFRSGSGGVLSLDSVHLPQWTFFGAQNLRTTLVNLLGLTGSGGSYDEYQLFIRINENEENLGEGNIAQNREANYSPDPIKFRFATEILADGCYLGMQKPEVFNYLFSDVVQKGSFTQSSFDVLYMLTMGRSPYPNEVNELLNLVGKFTDNRKAAAAACTVITASLEGLNGR